MFGFGKKKKKEQEDFQFPEIKHTHTFKDMPWYMDVTYNGTLRTAGYTIIEPYICVVCGERKNVVLERANYSDISVNERRKIFSDVRHRYKEFLKPRAIVEDMINNILLVKDINHLNMVEEMRGLPHRNCGTSANMKTLETDYKIKVKDTK